MKTTKVIFHLVKNSKEKLSKILTIAQTHYERQEPLLFFVPDTKAAHFLDELFWKYPEMGFMPHQISDQPVKEFILISQQRKNFLRAKFACNLWPTPLLTEEFPVLHEWEDLTSSVKQSLSQSRFEAYREAKYIIESR